MFYMADKQFRKMFFCSYYCILFVMCLVKANVINGSTAQYVPITWKDNATEVTATIRESAIINCQATGTPEPRIDTLLIKKSFSAEESTSLPIDYIKADDVITISYVSITRDHGVTILCAASQAFNGKNHTRTVALKTVQVNVYVEPTFEDGDELIVYSYLNQSISVTCRVVTSNPPIQSLEFRDGKNDVITSNNENYNVVVDLRMFNATLQIHALEEHHFGTNFVCEANNSVSKSRKTIKFIKRTIPKEVPRVFHRPVKNSRVASFDIFMGSRTPARATFLNIKYAKMFNRKLSTGVFKNHSSFTWHNETAIYNMWKPSNDKFACYKYTETHLLTICSINLLEPDSAYIFILQAGNDAGVSDWSSSFYAFTAEVDDDTE